MDIVQLIMLVTAGGVAYMIYKQIDSGSFQQIHKDREQNQPQTPQNQEVANHQPLQMDDKQKLQRVEELLDKTDQLVSEGNFSEAKKSIEAALILHQNSDNYMRQGFILKNLHEYSGAIESFTEVIKLEPNNDMAHLFMAEIYSAKKEYTKADEAFEAALKIDNSFDKTHVEYAKMLQATDQNEKAKEHLKLALDIDADNEEALELLAQLDEEKSDEKN